MTDFLKIAKSIVVHFAHYALTASKRLKRPRKSLQEAKDHHMYLDGLILSV